MSLTIAPSPFGSLVVSVAETGSTLSVTTVATSPSVLTMALGVPGPAGATGATGATGPAGAAGVGVPVGGTTNQALVKSSATNYDTTWAGPFLPLDGGMMNYGSNVIGIFPEESQIYFDNGAGVTTLSITGLSFNDGAYGISDGGIVFPDSTTQTTAGLPLTGGTMTEGAYVYFPFEAGQVTISGEEGVAINNAQLNLQGSSGIAFPDTSYQDTAGLPLTGGTLTGAVSFDDVLVTFGGVGAKFQNNDGEVDISGSGIIFADASVQSTAFPGYTGTTSEYIDGTGDYVTFPEVGDRYLTSSTSTLTINNGNGKTMTVETGLSYSTQQDITVSYNASNHMHGTVVSYNPSTGVLVFDANQHTGSGTYSNWEVNVGGVNGAILPVDGTAGQVLAKIDGTNFNTEWISLGNVALNNYATTAQAQAGTSTSTVISPATLLDAKYFGGGISYGITAWATGTSGTGASAGAQNANGRLNTAPTTAIGYATACAPIVNPSRGLGFSGGFDFSKRVIFGARINRNVASPDSNSVWRFSIGKFQTVSTVGDLASRGLMIKVAGSGALQLLVHNGTTLTTTTSSFTPSSSSAYDVLVVSDGSGNATLYVNGSSVATSTGAPTTASGSQFNGIHFECENTSVITGSPQTIALSHTFAQVNV